MLITAAVRILIHFCRRSCCARTGRMCIWMVVLSLLILASNSSRRCRNRWRANVQRHARCSVHAASNPMASISRSTRHRSSRACRSSFTRCRARDPCQTRWMSSAAWYSCCSSRSRCSFRLSWPTLTSSAISSCSRSSRVPRDSTRLSISLFSSAGGWKRTLLAFERLESRRELRICWAFFTLSTKAVVSSTSESISLELSSTVPISGRTGTLPLPLELSSSSSSSSDSVGSAVSSNSLACSVAHAISVAPNSSVSLTPADTGARSIVGSFGVSPAVPSVGASSNGATGESGSDAVGLTGVSPIVSNNVWVWPNDACNAGLWIWPGAWLCGLSRF
mmetsp:Transcript_3014/g.5767  ORF Transcript_3014/g.5767 Transcript_3014/m.5767 type:complete len:335 (-) Transcript_3014:56-1060(-)